MLHRLILENFKSHEYTELEFSKGTNLFLGIIGSGKTSVLDGIAFALFASNGVKSISNLIRRGKDRLKVVLEFSVGGKWYKVEREVSNNRSAKARLYDESGLIAEGQQTVTREITRILGIDHKVFSHAVYSAQNEIMGFLESTSDRKKIDELLGLKRFETLRANTQWIANRLKDRLRYIDETYDPERLGQLKDVLHTTQEEVSNLRLQQKQISEELKQQEVRLQELESKLLEVKRQRDEYDKLKQERTRLQTSIKELESRIQEYQSQLNDYLSTGRSVDDAIAQLDRETSEQKKQLDDVKRRITEIDNKRSELDRLSGDLRSKLLRIKNLLVEKSEIEKQLEDGGDIDHLRNRLSSIDQELESLTSEKSAYENEKNQLLKFIKELSDVSGRCPVCGRELDSEHKLSLENSYRERVKELDRLIDEHASRLTALRKTRESLTRVLETHIKLSDRLSVINDEVSSKDTLLAKYKEVSEELKHLEDLRTNLEEHYRKTETRILQLQRVYDDLRKYKHLLSDKEMTEVKLKETEMRLSRLRYDEGSYDRVFNELSNVKSTVSRLRAELASMEREIRTKEDLITSYLNQVNELEKLAKSRELYRDEYEFFTRLVKAIEETQVEIRTDLIGAINASMNEIWQSLYPYGDITGVRINAENNYEPEVFGVDGEWRSYNTLSGGEKTSLALALRIALAMVLTNNLSWLILDEPTHNLDPESIFRLAETLKKISQGWIEQVFIITHDEVFMQAEYDKVFLFERDKSRDEKTLVKVYFPGVPSDS